MNVMKQREYFLYAKKIKTKTFFQQFVSSLSLLINVEPFWILPMERKQRMLFCIRLHKIQIQPLMTDGLPRDAFHTFLDLKSPVYLIAEITKKVF